MVGRNELHQQLRAQATELLVPLVAGREQSICIVDPPRSANCGDAALLLGQLVFLREHFPHATLRFIDYRNGGSEAMRLIANASLLIFPGGGNFGDIWFEPHAFRVRVLDRFPHVPKLQLPQSISFSDPAKRDRTERAIAHQADFRLCVRDHKSLAYARAHFPCEPILCPDTAYFLPAFERDQPRCDVLALLREDRERRAPHEAIFAQLQRAAGGSIEILDWAKPDSNILSSLDWRLDRLRNVLPDSRLIQRTAFWLREQYARARTDYGLAVLSRGRRVVTDRLHGLILSSILGIPTTAFDTADGKLAAFYDTWLRGAPNLALAERPDDL